MALRFAHLLYMARGVFARNLYRRVKTKKPTTCVRTPVAIVKPWTIKYEIYTVDALGSLFAKIAGASMGESIICLATAVAAEDNVVIRNS